MQQYIIAAVLLLLTAPAGSAPSCSVHDKVDCGYLGIQQAECEGRACCWQASLPDVPWCYHPQETATTYVTSAWQTKGSCTILTLQLQQAVLPQYGPDFSTLQVLVEPQTLQRLHVKISPTSSSKLSSAGLQEGESSATAGSRWEVPEWLIPRPAAQEFDPAASLYSVELPQQGQPFGFTVLRHVGSTRQQGQQQAPQQPVFDTGGAKLVFKEQYMEITTSLAASTTLYGLGETINPPGSLALPRDGRTITLWNYDVAAFNAGVNLYGSHPFVLQVYEDGSAAGVFLLNSNGMDVELQQTTMTYRVLGGVLDFYFLLGPSPELVIQQYHEVIGRPAMPPYWALGFHQCRWGYQTLADVEGVVAAYSAADIPLEVIWTDIDYMYRYRDFTTDPARFEPTKFKAFIDRLHAQGQRWVPITDCGIPHAPDDPAFTSGLAQGVFIKDITRQPYLGQVWPGPTHYPDFLAVNRTWPWWKDQLQRLWDKVPYDGMWIDMNEASNFCEGEVCSLPAAATLVTSLRNSSRRRRQLAPGGLMSRRAGKWSWITQGANSLFHAAARSRGKRSQDNPSVHTVQNDCELNCRAPSADNKLAFPPYSINNLHNKVPLGSKTLPMTSQHVDGELQYNTHNLYGLSEAAATRWALQQITDRRPFILSRSTFPGSGRFAAHWTGDNAATWQDLRWSVQGLLNSNMWGLAMAGADICGFQGDTSEELCARWISAGAFYTFTRNHNTLGAAPQELYRWPTVAEAARKALALRYRLLPYLYTCLYKAHTEGGTVARPVFFEFAADQTARALSTQWMLGRSILVAPVLDQGAEAVNVYLPAATWHSPTDGSWTLGPVVKRVEVALTDALPVFVRGGSIVALQEPLNTTDAVRRSPITLVVALDRGRLPDANGRPQADAAATSRSPQEAAGSSGTPHEAAGSSGTPQEAAGSSGTPQEAAGSSSSPQEAAGSSGKPQADAAASSRPHEAAGSNGRPKEATASRPVGPVAPSSSPEETTASSSTLRSWGYHLQQQQQPGGLHQGDGKEDAGVDAAVASSPKQQSLQRHLQQQQPGRQQQGRGIEAGADVGRSKGSTGRNTRFGSAWSAGVDDGCSNQLLAALAKCVAGATAAAGSAASKGGCKPGPLSFRCGSSNGLLLGCGSMYWDPKDTLEVPGEGSVHLLFSSMAQPDTNRGWVMMAPEGADVDAAVAACAGAAEVRPNGSSKSSYTQQLEAPVIAEVQVLGVGESAAPAGAEPQNGAQFAVWLNGARLPASQVHYDAGTGLLRATGLGLQISGVSRLEWRRLEEGEPLLTTAEE